MKLRCLRSGNCCYSYVLNLKTGNIVMGCLNAALSFAMFVLFVAMASTLESVRYVTEEGWGLNFRATANALYATSISFALVLVFKFCFDIFFVYGVVTERAKIILAYFIMWVVLLFITMIQFIVNVSRYSVLMVFRELFFIGLNFSAIFLTHSLYKRLHKKEEEEEV